MFNNEVSPVNIVRFEEINDELIKKVAMKTRVGAGPFGFDGDGWKKAFNIKQF